MKITYLWRSKVSKYGVRLLSGWIAINFSKQNNFVAHRQLQALKQFQQLLIQLERLQRLSLQYCQEIEPELAHFRGAMGFIQDEGQIQVDDFIRLVINIWPSIRV